MARALFIRSELESPGWFDVPDPAPPTFRLFNEAGDIDEYERGWFRDTSDPAFTGTLAYRYKTTASKAPDLMSGKP